MAAVLPVGRRQALLKLPTVLRGVEGAPIGQPADSAVVRHLAMTALDAARAAGAEYADVQVSRLVSQNLQVMPRLEIGPTVEESESRGIGVRVLVHGGWGFSSSPFWEVDEAARLGRDAALQARTNDAARMTSYAADMGRRSAANGHWSPPGVVDPFVIPLAEKCDFLQTLSYAANARWVRGVADLGVSPLFIREERATATTDGTFVTQTFYMAEALDGMPMYAPPVSGLARGRERQPGLRRRARVPISGFERAQQGWEMIANAHFLDQLGDPKRLDDAVEFARARTKPVDVERVDVVFSADAVADLIADTLGPTTQIDRSVGYLANSAGTTMIANASTALDTFQLGGPLITISANRSLGGGLATARWDDEGMEPDEFALVRSGVLHDFQTNREQAGWLAEGYKRRGQPVLSHGCARSAHALVPSAQRSPNLVLQPGAGSLTFDQLVADTTRGIAVLDCDVTTDFQMRTGTGGRATMREIVNGRLGAIIEGGTFLFDTIELWTSVDALGGSGSLEVHPADEEKFGQTTWFSVAAVPMRARNVRIIDVTRKA